MGKLRDNLSYVVCPNTQKLYKGLYLLFLGNRDPGMISKDEIIIL